MRERVSPRNVLHNLQSQVEQLPHLANMTRSLLERMAQPHANDPPPPWRERDGWTVRLIGAALIGGGVVTALGLGNLSEPATAWPAWLMSASGLYLILRR